MADVAALGISVDSRQAASAAGDLDKLSAAAGRAETSTAKLARSIGVSEERMARYAAAATRVGVAVAAAGVAAAGALALMVKRTLENVDEQAKLARQLGGTIDGLRGLQIAAADAGVDTGALASSLGRFQAVLGEAERGTGTAVGALDRLGLSASELSALDIDERLAVIIERMEGLGLSATQSADVLRQFGIRNAEVLRLVQQGADVLRASRREVEEFGLSISQVDAASIERANDAMGRISRVAEVFATRLTVALAPALEAVANWLNELTRANGGWRDSAQGAADAVVESLIWVVEAYEDVNKAAAQFLLFFAEMQEASARFGIAARGMLGIDPSQMQLDIIAAAEAQRAYIAELENTESAADRLRAMLDEVRNAAAPSSTDSSPFAPPPDDIEAIKKAAEAYRDLHQEQARAIELAQADLFEARGDDSMADQYREAVEWQDALAKGEGRFGETQRANLAAQLEQLRAIRAETEALQQVESLRSDLMTDEESAIAQRDSRLELLREALEMEAITKAEYRELERATLVEFHDWEYEQLAQKYANEQALAQEQREFEQREMQARMAAASSFFGNLATITAAGGKKMFAVTKAFQIAAAIIDAFTAASGAYAVGARIGGPPLGAAFAAAAFGAQMARVASMQATEIGNTSASNRQVAGNVAPAAPAAAAPAQDVTVRIDSDRNLFTRADIQQIIAGISDAVGDGANLRLASA